MEALDTVRLDGGAVGQRLLAGRYVMTARTAVAQQRHDHRFGAVLERDRHDTAFGQVTIRSRTERQTWVVGGAVEYDAYRPRDLSRFAHTFTVAGVFVQDEVDVARGFSLSASARLDRHS